MRPRLVTAVLAAVLALWGAGLPRFAHVMTAHLPANGNEDSACSHCCSQCSLSNAAAGSEPVDDADLPVDESGGSEGPHRCPVCDLLATLLTPVAAAPGPALLWQPLELWIVERSADPQEPVEFDPFAARGPPCRA